MAAKTKKTKDEVKVKPEKKVKKTKVAKTTKAVQEETVDMKIPLPASEKKEIIDEFATKEGDTGSPEVQIALLTKRIEKLVGHLKTNPNDNHSRRGLLGMVSKRRRLINYLSKKDSKRSKEIESKLKLGK